jgi:hypothetical protein
MDVTGSGPCRAVQSFAAGVHTSGSGTRQERDWVVSRWSDWIRVGRSGFEGESRRGGGR